MVMAQNIARSTKRMGKYEKKIIQILAKYFRQMDYEVIPHSSLNIAWGCIISDVDLLLLKDHKLTYVEVKSSRDNIARAKQQIDRIMDYIDYAYVATDKQIKNWNMRNVGLIYVQEETVTLVKKGKKFSNKPKFYSVVALKKKCIARLCGDDNHYIMLINKYELAQQAYTKRKCTRACLKEIVTCGKLCVSACPIMQTGT
jgi:hypothetical protein